MAETFEDHLARQSAALSALSDDQVPRATPFVGDGALSVLLDTWFGDTDQRTDAALGLVLTLGGQTVSGVAVSHAEWLRLLSESASRASDLVGNVVEGALQEHHALSVAADRRRAIMGWATAGRRFIHLRDAEIFSADRVWQLDTLRVPLAAVAGWTMGNLSN